MIAKVSQQAFADFYRATDKDKGPRSEAAGEPRRLAHALSNTGRPDGPTLGVSWYSANGYCAWRGMRLLPAEEWERIVRPDPNAIFPWGNENTSIAENAGYRRFAGLPDTPSTRLIRGMWSDGPEWTSRPRAGPRASRVARAASSRACPRHAIRRLSTTRSPRPSRRRRRSVRSLRAFDVS